MNSVLDPVPVGKKKKRRRRRRKDGAKRNGKRRRIRRRWLVKDEDLESIEDKADKADADFDVERDTD